MRGLVAALVLLCSVSQVAAKTIVVPVDEPTIYDALRVAADGDRILVLPGRYVEGWLLISKRVELVGVHGPEETIIDGGGIPVSILVVTANATVTGFTITGGRYGGPFDHPDYDSKTYWGGAGIMVASGSPLFRDCVIEHNVAMCGDPWDCLDTRGGGVHVTAGSPVFEQCIIANNEAQEDWKYQAPTYGGGIYVASGSVELWFCTLTGNRADIGPNLANYGGGALVRHAILWPEASSGVIDAAWSDIPDYDGTGNLDVDPLFADASAEDYRLDPLSPLVDRGDSNFVPASGKERDLDGMPRIVDGNLDRTTGVDIGAHEFDHVRLAVTGDFTPGGSLTVHTRGTAGLSTVLLVGFGPTVRPLPPFGYLFVEQPFIALPWSSAPSDVTVPLGSNFPTPFLLVLQGIVFGGHNSGNLSNAASVLLE